MRFTALFVPAIVAAQVDIGQLLNGAINQVQPTLSAYGVSLAGKTNRQLCYGSGYDEINTALTVTASLNEFRTEQNFTCLTGEAGKQSIFSLSFSNSTNLHSCSTFPSTPQVPSRYDYLDFLTYAPDRSHTVMNLNTIIRTNYLYTGTLFAGNVYAGSFLNGTAIRIDFDPANRTQIVNACNTGTPTVTYPIPMSILAIYQ